MMKPLNLQALDRYADFTDLELLKEFSCKPLRKAVRVNTIKMSVDEFQSIAKDNGWQLTPVPWCDTGFFIDRDDKSEALGRDALQLFGSMYIQEAASMLPPALLQVQPGEMILDMSAAPGSKTTQMGATMQGEGVIVANDIQEKRLWTLKNAIHRLGVHNAIVVKKVGQWYGAHMTERFDKVLCDAPCTGQGTVRKDPTAMQYVNEGAIRKLSSLQKQLLESAVHCTKVGGRIVYSTCTLTPEENEEVVLSILDKYPTQLRVLDPDSLGIAPPAFFASSIKDSVRVQHSISHSSQLTAHSFIRLWPQTYDCEGFFCAVLEKTAPTHPVRPMERVRFQERELQAGRKKAIEEQLKQRYGASLLEENDRLFERENGTLSLSTKDVATCVLPMKDFSIGIPFGKKLKSGELIPSQELMTLRGHLAVKNTYEVTSEELTMLMKAQDIPCPASLEGHIVITYDGRGIGLCLAREGMLKNNLPRSLIYPD